MLTDPFEAAIAAELEASPPESPAAPPCEENASVREDSGDLGGDREWPCHRAAPPNAGGRKEEDEEDEEEDNVVVDIAKHSSADLRKAEKIK